MCRRLIHFASLILILGLAGSAPAELAAHWTFDDGAGTTALDSSGNNYHATLINDPVWVVGYEGGGLNTLDGGYGAIQGLYYDTNPLPDTTGLTVCAWIRTESSGGQYIASFDRNEYWRLEINGYGGGPGQVGWDVYDDSGQVDYGSVTRVDDGQWHHVAGVYDNGTMTVYIDGDAEPSTTGGSTWGRWRDVRYGFIGKNSEATEFNSPAPGGNPVDGDIDDLRIYHHALSQMDIRILTGHLESYEPDPEDGAKFTDTWANLSWTPGPHAVSHDVYFYDTFDDVNAGAANAFASNTAETFFTVGFPGMPFPDGLVPGTTYYWRIDDVDAGGAKITGNIWSFWIPPTTAYDPVPGDGEAAEPIDVVLSWSPGMNAIMTGVYFGTDADQVANAVGGPPHMDTTYDPSPLTPETTYYWRVDTFNGATWIKGDVWTFTTRPDIPITTDPNLVAHLKLDEGAGTTTLDWSGHGYHGKLFGTEWTDAGWLYDEDKALSFADEGYVAIEELSYSGEQTEVTACAWIRTDDPNGQYIVSFDRDEKYRLSINTAAGSGPGQVDWDVMTMRGSTEVQVDYGSVTRVDDGLWHHVCGVFNNGVSTIYIDGLPEPSATWGGWTYGTSLTRFGLLGANSEATVFNENNRGDGTGITGDLSEVRIYSKALTQEEILEAMRGYPLMAWDLRPTNGRILEVDTITSVSWRPGDQASQHDVYFGDDADAVANADDSDATGVYRGKQINTIFTPREGFEWGQRYHWRIDELNNDGSITKGRPRVINIADYLVVDSFEDYNDFTPDEIWNTWIDGFGTATNGATAGHLDPVDFASGEHYAETVIVQSGRQSMPLYYDNNLKYSEAQRTFASASNWTRHGVTELSLWYNGDPCNVAEPMYVAIANSTGNPAVVYNDDPNLITDTWIEWVIPLQAFAEQGVNLASVNSITIGLGTRGNTATPGGSGVVYFDDIRLYRPRPVAIENFSFELPGTEKQTGFDEVPGWNTDGPCADSGVETGYTPTDGDWTAYLMSGDPSVWQLTDRTITKWDVLELKVDARITWAATTMNMALYYDDNGARVPIVSSEVALTDAMQEYTLSFSAGDVPDSIGRKIGIEFSNVSSGDTWIGLDNVRLEPPAQ
ncbi:LamG domain-containing protein [Planctomycetota bacterium]